MTDQHDAKMQAWNVAQDEGPYPGTRWRHYKGGLYVVEGPCVIEATAEAAVAYRSLRYGTVLIRSVANFFEYVTLQPGGECVARFRPEPWTTEAPQDEGAS